jgi:GntR family transcriptional regulator / MocR family aminotransferase
MPPLTEVPELLIALDPAAAEPLHRQIYRGIRDGILAGRLGPGVRVPSTRRLAGQLGVSRSTLLVAFTQLSAEGYLVGTVGAGSRVPPELPTRHLERRRAAPPAGAPARPAARLSVRGEALATMPRVPGRRVPAARAFRSGIPPVGAFPLALWARLAARRQRRATHALLYHGTAAGYAPLREAIAGHLAAARGVRCTAEQVLVVSSTQEALELAARLLLDPGDTAWLEDPGWSGARGALVAAGAAIVPVPVDDEGLLVARGVALAPTARLAYVSPSHQYPTGATLSLARRLELLDWATRHDAWVLEDDYDSEYRYAGRPLAALQGLDDAGRVLYVGTFNKTLFPALRLAYLVLPPALVDTFRAARAIGAQHAATLDQAIVADFLVDGHYARHLHRMRALCRERRDALLAAAERALPGLLDFRHIETGLHLLAALPPHVDDAHAARLAAEHGIEAAPFSAFHLGPCVRGGFVLGYADLTPPEIDVAMDRLAEALGPLRRGVPC